MYLVPPFELSHLLVTKGLLLCAISNSVQYFGKGFSNSLKKKSNFSILSFSAHCWNFHMISSKYDGLVSGIIVTQCEISPIAGFREFKNVKIWFQNHNLLANVEGAPPIQGTMLAFVKSCYDPLRLGTVIVLISSGIDFVKDCQFGHYGLCQRDSKSGWTLQETHRNSTNYARDEARTSECLLD